MSRPKILKYSTDRGEISHTDWGNQTSNDYALNSLIVVPQMNVNELIHHQYMDDCELYSLEWSLQSVGTLKVHYTTQTALRKTQIGPLA